MINEAFDNKRRDLGEVSFSETSLDDLHVKDIIDKISIEHGIDKKDIIASVQAAVAKFDDVAKKSPILYDTIKKNVVEKAIFDLLKKHPITHTAPTFEIRIFSKLIRLIKVEHDQFFPLRNFIDHKYLYNPVIIIVPSEKKEYAQYNIDVTTAAATPNGEFIFCKPFMQHLIDYANLKGVKPKGKKYISNGGEIPDEYAYIEFLIIHEFMHYTQADFHYQDVLNADGEIINWVGDFRSNYLLVKSGFEQLPIGLFSDHVNYDRQKSYREMYEIVKAEFEKLNKDQQNKVSDALNDMGDNHSQSKQDGKPGGKGKPSNPKDPKNGKSTDEILDDLDKNSKEIERKLSNGKDVDKEEPPKSNDGKAGNSSNSRTGSSGRGNDGAGQSFDYSKIRPTFTWKKLLSKMITDASNTVDETFQKPHRRNITGVHLAQQTGSAAMKPGEITIDNEIKMGIVVDSSGSMTSVISQVYANLHNLMKSKSNVRKSEFYLIKFSAESHIYKCNFVNNSYKELSSVFDKTPAEKTGSVKELFTKHFGTSTNFDSKLTNEIAQLARKRYNILIMSDSDILHGENFENVKKLVTEHKNVFFILDSRETFVRLCQMLKQVSKNITHFD